MTERELWVVGVGPGAADQLTPVASAVLARADCVVAAARHAGLAGAHPNIVLLKGIPETSPCRATRTMSSSFSDSPSRVMVRLLNSTSLLNRHVTNFNENSLIQQ